MVPAHSHQEQIQQHRMLELVLNFHNAPMQTRIKQLAIVDKMLVISIQQPPTEQQHHHAHLTHVLHRL